MAAPQLKYESQLESDALPGLLSKIHDHRVPGVVEVRAGDTEKQLYVRDGNVIFATSNNPEDRLGVYLLREGLMDREGFELIARQRSESTERAGVLMIKAGLLSPRQLREAVRKQVERIAWSFFEYEAGTVCFRIHEHRQSNQVTIQLPLRQMIYEGIRDRVSTTAALNRLGRLDIAYKQSWNGEDLIDIGLTGEEFALLQALDGKRTLREIVGLDNEKTDLQIRLVYAFYVLKLARPVDPSDRTQVTIRLQTTGDKFD